MELPAASETRPALERRLAERLLATPAPRAYIVTLEGRTMSDEIEAFMKSAKAAIVAEHRVNDV